MSFRTVLSDELKLPADAVDWLIRLFDSIQVFDDYADGDPVDRKDLDSLIWNTLVTMPLNPFYARNTAVLIPALSTAIQKWQASDRVERMQQANAMSFVWRAGYFDIVLLVYSLCFGYVKAAEDAHVIMSLYDEKYEDYIKEVNHA